MKKYFNIIALMLALFLISNVQAIQFRQEKSLDLNSTHLTTNRAILSYYQQDYLDDKITNGKPFEYYAEFYSTLATWNEERPFNRIEWCNFTVYENKKYYNISKPIFSRLITEDFGNRKYFSSLSIGDFNILELKCYFSGNRTLQQPVDFFIESPTRQCRQCQKLEWAKEEAEIRKIENLRDYNTFNLELIQRIFSINLGFFRVFYWIFLIFALLFSVFLMFNLIYFVYMLIKKVSK